MNYDAGMDSSPLPAALATDVGFLLTRCGTAAVRSVNRAMAPLGLRARHYAALCLAAEGGGIGQRAIGGLLTLDPSVVVSLVDDLEQRGLVERATHQDDRRTRIVRITVAGSAVLAEGRRAADHVQAGLLGDLPEDEAERLRRLLCRVLANVGAAEFNETAR